MELPFRLLVASIVVGLTVPVALNGLSAYEARQLDVRAMQAVDALVRVAQQFYLSGGGVEDVRVDLPSGLTTRIESLTLGDSIDGRWSTTGRFQVSGQREVFFTTDPPVPMTAGDGPLRLGPGQHLVRVHHDGEGPVRLAVAG